MDSNDQRFNRDGAGNDSTAMAIGSKILIAAILLLFAVVLFVVALHIYAYCFWGRRISFRRRRLDFVGQQDPLRQRVGLSKSAIEAIPVFVYQSKDHNDGLQCAVCLCEFEENEKARLLPKCHHSFHIDCIDMWFHSHSTCPLCRASVQPDTPAESDVVLVGDEEAASGRSSETDQQMPLVSDGNASTSMEPDLEINFFPNSCRHDEFLPSPTYPTKMLFWATQKRVPSVSNSAFLEQGTTSTSRKTLDKIIIDIPRRVDSFSSPRLFCGDDQQVSPSGQSLKSPSIRLRSLRSLKRLSSKGKLVVPQSPNDGRNIHIEQGDSSQSRSG